MSHDHEHDHGHDHDHDHHHRPGRMRRVLRRLRKLVADRGLFGALKAVLHYGRWRLRLLLSGGSALTGDAKRAVAAAQKVVSSHDPHPHYAEAYRSSERRYWEHIPAWIIEDFGGGAGACLDIGCAYGTLMVLCKQVTGCEAYGTDFVPYYMSESLVAEQGLHYEISNIELDPIPWDRKFDIIVMTEVLEHLNFQARPTLQKLASALAPGGRFYLSCPDAAEWGPNHRYYSRYEDLPMPSDHSGSVIDDHVWHFSEDELRAVVASAGLDIERFAYARGDGSRHFNLTLKARQPA